MNVSIINEKELTQEQKEVLNRFVEFQKAMIEKDSEKLNELMLDNYTLTHMSGKTQTKQEYIDEIMVEPLITTSQLSTIPQLPLIMTKLF